MTCRVLLVTLSLLAVARGEKPKGRHPRNVYQASYAVFPGSPLYAAVPVFPERLNSLSSINAYPWYDLESQNPVSYNGQQYQNAPVVPEEKVELKPSNMELGLLHMQDMQSILPLLNKPKRRKERKHGPSLYPAAGASDSLVYAIVLRPGDEIISSLRRLAKTYGLKAVYIITCVAGINEVTLRYALNPRTNERKIETIQKDLEIASLTGTVAADGSGYHLHISLYDKKGDVIGGHVAGDIVVSVTAEIVVGEALNYVFTRRVRPEDGLSELQVDRRRSSS